MFHSQQTLNRPIRHSKSPRKKVRLLYVCAAAVRNSQTG